MHEATMNEGDGDNDDDDADDAKQGSVVGPPAQMLFSHRLARQRPRCKTAQHRVASNDRDGPCSAARVAQARLRSIRISVCGFCAGEHAALPSGFPQDDGDEPVSMRGNRIHMKNARRRGPFHVTLEMEPSEFPQLRSAHSVNHLRLPASSETVWLGARPYRSSTFAECSLAQETNNAEAAGQDRCTAVRRGASCTDLSLSISRAGPPFCLAKSSSSIPLLRESAALWCVDGYQPVARHAGPRMEGYIAA
ncbi:hypothetical protein CTRI78_v001241 [Colletotrichum trifolii]|uniref:Uncharacterized protein n=1 Tax=Colletotrichum trifolii TaxID=5466 RepID=A0A4R8RQ80_COLTR|nr:hypothetical protein CTRI78_v001241 [Colletotrichum trifolii]